MATKHSSQRSNSGLPPSAQATEWCEFLAAGTGRPTRQYTNAAANSYPLYYFVPSITADQRWMVFHSDRSGAVQLHRMDMSDGSTLQLTDGSTLESGWAIWCEPQLNGIFNHLSALDPVRKVVYYFDSDDLLAVDIESLEHRQVASLPGRIPIGQSHFSPDGTRFAFIDADREEFQKALERRYQLQAVGEFGTGAHVEWRNTIPTTLKVVDTGTGAVTTVVELDYHVHHVLFLDDETLLVNHSKGRSGMWLIGLDGRNERELRPGNERGQICHQIVTSDGLLYETSNGINEHTGNTWFGHYFTADDSYTEWQLPPGIGYVHIGNDPRGTTFFIEVAGDRHGVYRATPREGTDQANIELLYQLNEVGHNDIYDQQRFHAHPWLSPDRKQLFFTDVVDGFAQILSIDVSDITKS